MRVLIVEDDYVSIISIKGFLKKKAECIVAHDGEEAVSMFKSAFESGNKFDLVLLDIMMPKMTGHEVLEEIRNFEKSKNKIDFEDRTKIIMITALNDYQNIKKAFKNVCDGYLTKPLKMDSLLSELKKLNL